MGTPTVSSSSAAVTPELNERDVDDAAAAVASAGIASVTNGVAIDARAFAGPRYGDAWAGDDRPFGYAAPITALSVDENRVELTISPGASIGATANVTFASPAAIAALAPSMRFVNRATTVGGPAKTTADAFWESDRYPSVAAIAGVTTIGVDGVIAIGGTPNVTDVAIPDPLAFARQLLTQDLGRRQIAVRGEASGASPTMAPAVLWSHDSKPLDAMLADMWLPSDNLIAECWLRALAHPTADRPATADQGATMEIAALRALGIDASTVMIVDGSGLSREDAVPPRVFTTLLAHGWASPNRASIFRALPVAGVRGTLRHRFAGTVLLGRLFAKTGTLTNVSNLAGYLATRTHGPVAFAILADDALIDDAPLVDLQRRILIALLNGA